MRDGAHYNHQTWEKGRNVVRYVPREQISHLQNAISGYQKYTKLTNAYADAVIQRTRSAEKRGGPARTPHNPLNLDASALQILRSNFGGVTRQRAIQCTH
jgi:hypothetical protein